MVKMKGQQLTRKSKHVNKTHGRDEGPTAENANNLRSRTNQRLRSRSVPKEKEEKPDPKWTLIGYSIRREDRSDRSETEEWTLI